MLSPVQKGSMRGLGAVLGVELEAAGTAEMDCRTLEIVGRSSSTAWDAEGAIAARAPVALGATGREVQGILGQPFRVLEGAYQKDPPCWFVTIASVQIE